MKTKKEMSSVFFSSSVSVHICQIIDIANIGIEYWLSQSAAMNWTERATSFNWVVCDGQSTRTFARKEDKNERIAGCFIVAHPIQINSLSDGRLRRLIEYISVVHANDVWLRVLCLYLGWKHVRLLFSHLLCWINTNNKFTTYINDSINSIAHNECHICLKSINVRFESSLFFALTRAHTLCACVCVFVSESALCSVYILHDLYNRIPRTFHKSALFYLLLLPFRIVFRQLCLSRTA